MIRIRDEYNDLTVAILEAPVQEYVEHYFNTQFLRPFTENPHLQTKRGNGLLYPSYGDLPKPKINELVIPTGATRWAYTVVACDRPTKEDIYNTAAENANRLILEFGAHRLWDDTLSIPAGGNGEVWPCRMVMIPLQPHPVKPAELDNDRDPIYDDPNDPWGLWLIPFVDARYFWQFHDVAAITEQVKEYTDPLSIVNFVAGRLDADIKVYDTTNSATQNVHTNYAAALPDVAGNDYENAAVVLDSVFWHLGLTLVPDMQAMGSTLNPVDAEKWLGVGMALTEEMYQQNLEGKLYNMRTGGSFSLTDNGMPVRSFGGSLLTSATKWQPDIIQIPDGEGDWISTLSIAGTTEPNTELRMRTKYKDPVDNDLAYQLSDDYYARFNRSYNFTFAATQNWQPTGYDDYVIHYQKIREHKGVRAAQAFTRIRSWQGNLFPVANPEKPPVTGVQMIRFRLIEPIFCEICSADAQVLSRPLGSSKVTDEDDYGVVHVHDFSGCWLRGANLDLVGRIGHAVLLETFPYEVGDPPCGPITAGRHWEIVSLCCDSNSGCT